MWTGFIVIAAPLTILALLWLIGFQRFSTTKGSQVGAQLLSLCCCCTNAQLAGSRLQLPSAGNTRLQRLAVSTT